MNDRTPTPEKYPANSEKKRQDKVISGDVVHRRSGKIDKILRAFVAEDVGDIKTYILAEVVVPAVKDMISDAVKSSVDRFFYGSSPRTSKKGYTSYSSYSTRSSTRKPVHNFKDIVLENREEAETVLDRLADLIDEYEVATVSDLYDLVGISGTYADDRWGWTRADDFRIRHVREGYMIDLPKPRPVD